jgi:hypothetical protein
MASKTQTEDSEKAELASPVNLTAEEQASTDVELEFDYSVLDLAEQKLLR